MKKSLLILFLLAGTLVRAQTNLYVDSAVSVSGAGTTWSAAYKTINEALNTVNAASTTVRYVINIAQGTYYPTGAQTGTNRDSTFLITRGGIQLIGGYPTGGSIRNIAAYPTILSGNIGSAGSSSDNSYHVLVASNVSTTSDSILIKGLRITAGNANGATNATYNSLTISRGCGGAAYNKNIWTTIRYDSCSFYNNTAIGNGGALENEGSVVHLSGCSFNANTATGTASTAGFGGAVYYNILSASLSVTGCMFNANTAANGGGAILCDNFTSQSVVIYGCSFMGNVSGVYNGGAVCLLLSSTSSATVRRCTFTGNTSNSGGGLYFYFNSSLSVISKIDSCSFSGNMATGSFSEGGGLYLNSGFTNTASQVTNCSFTGNLSTYRGGGLSAYNGFARRCTFTNNSTGGSGGGAYCSVGYVDSSAFSANKAVNGGGVYFSAATKTAYGTADVYRCVFNSDTAGLSGGGVYATGSAAFINCKVLQNQAARGGGMYFSATAGAQIYRDSVQGNTATQHGAGVYMQDQAGTLSALFANSLISGNKAGLNGGGIYDTLCSPKIINCTLAGDTALNGNGIYNTNSASPNIQGCIIWEGANSLFNFNNSTPIVATSTVQGGYTGFGNLSSNPSFVSGQAAGLAPTIAGNYQLSACSPAIDHGGGASLAGTVDLAGNGRYFGGVNDQGAYEYQGVYPLGGPVAICSNTTAQYTNIISGGTWSSGNTIIATISSTGVLTPLAAGLVDIIYTVPGTGVCTGETIKTVTINTAPPTVTISNTGSDSTCTGGTTIHLTGSPIGYNWSVSNSSLATFGGGNTVYAGSNPGIDTIFYTSTSSNGCISRALRVITIITGRPLRPSPAGLRMQWRIGTNERCYARRYLGYNGQQLYQQHRCIHRILSV